MSPVHAKRAKIGLEEHDGDLYQHLPRASGSALRSSQSQWGKAERQSNSYPVGD